MHYAGNIVDILSDLFIYQRDLLVDTCIMQIDEAPRRLKSMALVHIAFVGSDCLQEICTIQEFNNMVIWDVGQRDINTIVHIASS